MHSISVFSDIAKFPDFRLKNVDVSRTQGVCHVILGSAFWPPIREQPPKRPILKRVKDCCSNFIVDFEHIVTFGSY